MTRRIRARSTRAQSIVETVVGMIFLIPIALFLLDIACLVLANTANDNLAKSACRAAASAASATGQGNATAARTAASNIVAGFQTSPIINDRRFVGGWWVTNGTAANPNGTATAFGTTNLQNPGPGQTSVVVEMVVRVPVPIPGFPVQQTFRARAVEPIVSIAP